MSRPLWKDAPTWAMWLAQDKDGEWGWWNLKPDRTASLWTQAKENEELFDYLSAGYVDRDGLRFATSKNWPESLEPRPMTTNQTIDGVPRSVLSDAFDELTDWNTPAATKLSALLDAPATACGDLQVLRELKADADSLGETLDDESLAELAALEAAQSQGEPVAYRCKEFQQAWENEKPWELATVALGKVYLERKELAERGVLIGRERETYLGLTIEPLYTEQPGPIAVVLPERHDLPHRDEYESADQHAAAVGEAKSFNACLDEVARLNPGAKP